MTFHKNNPPVASRPGTLAIPRDALPTRITVFDYKGEVFREAALEDSHEAAAFLETDETCWLDVQGLRDEDKLWALAEVFGLHPLTVEDATNIPQRAKSDPRPSYHVLIARVPVVASDGSIETPQLCIILGRSFVLTLQDRHRGFFDAVRGRIREGIGPIRVLGPDYLAYALLDAVVDHYFPIVEELSEELEALEEELTVNPGPACLSRIHKARQRLVVLRRIGWPQREALRELLRDQSDFVTAEVRVYLRDAEAHMAQIMEAVDSQREIATSLMDIYLSSVAQRTNDIMKVLTLMASVFIPLTFLAGIYGMNFEHMPELGWRYAYPTLMGMMAILTLGMLFYFHRRGWIGRG